MCPRWNDNTKHIFQSVWFLQLNQWPAKGRFLTPRKYSKKMLANFMLMSGTCNPASSKLLRACIIFSARTQFIGICRVRSLLGTNRRRRIPAVKHYHIITGKMIFVLPSMFTGDYRNSYAFIHMCVPTVHTSIHVLECIHLKYMGLPSHRTWERWIFLLLTLAKLRLEMTVENLWLSMHCITIKPENGKKLCRRIGSGQYFYAYSFFPRFAQNTENTYFVEHLF